MKHILLLLSLFLNVIAYSQTDTEEVQGNVSYVGIDNVYVTFVSTEGLKVGDSLFVTKSNRYESVLIINHLSSISCMCSPIARKSVVVSQKVIAVKNVAKPIEILTQQEKDAVAVNDAAIQAAVKKDTIHKLEARVYGRFSVSAYTNVTDKFKSSPTDTTKSVSANYRLRYNLELNAEHISNSKLSLESYLSFTHKLADATENYDGLRIYNFALKYDLNASSSLVAGRKINTNMANVGAVDGFQYEKNYKHFSVGTILGSRPDDQNYGFNAKLFQYGAFVGHQLQKDSAGAIQSSLAFFNQTNNLITDRRYAYFQHSNTLLKNVDLFCSFEADLYKLDRNLMPASTFDLTSTYVSIRYRPVKKLSLSLTYDARNNIYYYETYKKPLDSIFDKATRQGMKLQAIVRPIKFLTWGTTAGYRTNPKDTVPTLNAYSYLTYSNLPLIDASGTISTTALRTQNMNGMVYAVSLSRDFIEGKLFTELQYRISNYNFNQTALRINLPASLQVSSTLQNIAELSLNWRLNKKLMLTADFEATFEKDVNYGRLFINISQRF